MALQCCTSYPCQTFWSCFFAISVTVLPLPCLLLSMLMQSFLSWYLGKAKLFLVASDPHYTNEKSKTKQNYFGNYLNEFKQCAIFQRRKWQRVLVQRKEHAYFKVLL